MTKKKIEDYFDFSNAPAATHGSSVVVGRDDTRGMSETIAAPQVVPAPTWVAPAQTVPAPINDQVPAAQTAPPAFSMNVSDNQGHTVAPFNPAFVDITAPTQDTRSGTYPQEAVASVLRDTAGNPVRSGNGAPFTLPTQTTGNIPAGGKGGAGAT